MEINSEIAELCGAILGDGHLHNTENRITITGSLDDFFYYRDYLIPLFRKYFNITPRLVKIKGKNSYRLVLENKILFKFFINKVGLTKGRKVNISIPKDILGSSILLKFFIKGLFDTDGYIKFSKQKKKVNYYPRIRFSLYKTQLSLQLKQVFRILNFTFGFSVDKRNGILCYEISGHNNLDKWMRIIGSSNIVHITKFLIWKRLGNVPPKSNLKQRRKLLNLKRNFYKTYKFLY